MLYVTNSVFSSDFGGLGVVILSLIFSFVKDFWGERSALFSSHAEIAQGFSHIGRIDRFLQLAVPHRECLLADPVEGSWISPGGLGNQENSPRSKDPGGGTSCFPQPVFDIPQGFLRSEWS